VCGPPLSWDLSLFVRMLIFTCCSRIMMNALYTTVCMNQVVSIQVGCIHFTTEFQQVRVDLLDA
jgi:hypothetical protein